ncbi:MAG: DUF1989 domain-containing protein [Micromonosporaceae bacterium]
MVTSVLVPPGEGRAVGAKAGQHVRVVDVDGGQVGDLFAFAADDESEFASAEHTRVAIARLFPRPVRANLREALRDQGRDAPVVPQPLNVFMDVRAEPDGTLTSRPASSRPGDYISFRAAQDCLIVLSSCPMDIVPISSGGFSPLELQVH